MTESAENGYIAQIKAENENLDPSVFIHASKMLTDEIERVEKGFKYIDLSPNKRAKVAAKVGLPIAQDPNIVGRLLGPGGSTMRALTEQSGCKISILGKGSQRDKSKEEEQRTSGDPKHAHLNEELHVLVECFLVASQAYTSAGKAMDLLSRFMDPYYDPMADPELGGTPQEPASEGYGAPAPGGYGEPQDPYAAPPAPAYSNGYGDDSYDSGFGKAPRGAPRGRADRGRPYPSRGGDRGASRGGDRGGRGFGAPRGGDRGGRGFGAPRGGDRGGRGFGAPRGGDRGGRGFGAPRGGDRGGRGFGAPRGDRGGRGGDRGGRGRGRPY